jgi:hypothetical protein
MIFRKAVIVLLLLAVASSAGAQSFSPTDCLLAGGQCDASNTCVRYNADGSGFLLEQTLGTCQSSGPIIIGGGYDPPNPPPPGPYVAFINDTRSGDRVVSAKIPGELPGGRKELGVKVSPAGKTAKLRIQRISGTAGSAFFDAGGLTTTLNVTNGQRITIYGGDTSSVARNMAITATIDGAAVTGQFVFTVFRVNAMARVSGSSLETVLPDSARAASGKPVAVYQPGTPTILYVLRAQLMRTLFKDPTTIQGNIITALRPDGVRDERLVANKPDFDRVGHRTLDNLGQYGGIVFKGNIVPNIQHTDFSRNIAPFSVRESFNWRRTKRIVEKKIRPSGFTTTTQCLQGDDDDTDSDEDLIPEDGSIWTFDTPSFLLETPLSRNDAADGDIIRGWWQFVEWAEYGGVQVSKRVNWYWRYSNINPAGTDTLKQESSQPGDNTVVEDTTAVPQC